MDNIKIYTRGGSPAYGKPRIFLLGLNEDLDSFGEIIASEILALNNCAVFRADPEDSGNDPDLLLEQMRLVVWVCSSDFFARSPEMLLNLLRCCFAINLPVLPLMVEGDLEEVFNSYCLSMNFSSLQCISRTAPAEGKRPYEEQLKAYLESILPLDADAAQIKSHFKATIFLSYRKADREVILPFIRRIHGLEGCDDIAVWFDDYLIPGRPFEEEIFSALDGSDLFMLAVTPNIVAAADSSEENYVVQKEYPAAARAQKRIVAAELKETDRGMLLAKFAGIPDCIDANSDSEISAALRELSSRCSERGAGHDYCIGLAYLNGISTNTDFDRAFRLISSAARTGYIPAIETLIGMYKTGSCVKRNLDSALSWQRTLASLTLKEYEAAPTPANAQQCLHRLSALGNDLCDLLRYDEARSVFLQMISVLEKLPENPPFVRDLSVTYNKLGDIALSENDPAAAGEYFKKGLDFARRYFTLSEADDALRDLAISRQRLGTTELLLGNTEAARAALSDCRRHFADIVEKTPSLPNRRDYAIALAKSGDVEMLAKNFQQALEYYTESMNIRSELEAEDGSCVSRRDLSVGHEKIGNALAALGQYRDAEKHFEKSVALADELCDITGTVVHRVELSKLCSKIGEFYLNLGRPDDAEYYLKASLEIDEAVVDGSPTAANRHDLSVSFNRLAMMYRAQEKYSEAKEFYKKDFDLSKELSEEEPTEDNLRNYGLSACAMGDILVELEEADEARYYYSLAESVFIGLLEKRNSPVWTDDLAVTEYQIFRAYRNIEALKRAFLLWYGLVKDHPENTVYAERLELAAGLYEQFK